LVDISVNAAWIGSAQDNGQDWSGYEGTGYFVIEIATSQGVNIGMGHAYAIQVPALTAP
jgi:hypothetical protein